MATKALSRSGEFLRSGANDFFKPFNEWFDNEIGSANMLTVPLANIMEKADCYFVLLALPGMKKDDFKIEVNGNLLTISCERENQQKENDERYNRMEYNYSSFSRSFTLPDTVNRERTEAVYKDGVLKLTVSKRKDISNPRG